MKFGVYGYLSGSSDAERIGTISVSEDDDLVVLSDDPAIVSDLNRLISNQMRIGGFVRHYGRVERYGDDPKAHVTYAVIEKPGSRYFADALEETATRFWGGKQVGNYKVAGVSRSG